ncbi:hypothetical protein [Wolbachia endosymbiont (group A) of Bombylius major]|uniref:hypothetical protein n=1 Tax=Wolbachia endosymbiont (group A) of Bombylius major TaxID=2953988 RepID=UPI00222F5DE7|nr:hypothetical protein [Wolbachia endosymbiont (group A) of Bombylius major]
MSLDSNLDKRHHSRLLPIQEVTSSAARPSSWINDLFGWVKEKSKVVVSNVVNGDAAKELEDSRSEDIQMGSSDQQKLKQSGYDRAQEMEFQYMSKYDARKCNDKNVGAHSKKRGNSRQERQQYESKMSNEQSVISKSVNQSRVISSEKQQRLEVSHSRPKPTLSHHSDKKHSYYDGQPKKISERKEHTINDKQFNSNYTHSSQYKPMIGINNKWSEKISNERIDSRKMVGNINQNQQNSHSSKHAPLTHVTAQVDIPSTLLAFNVLAMKVTNQKFNKPLLPKKIQKGMRYAEKVRAEASGLKVGGRIGDALYFK